MNDGVGRGGCASPAGRACRSGAGRSSSLNNTDDIGACGKERGLSPCVGGMRTVEGPEQRSERKRLDILAAARKRFMVEGYASTGMEQVPRAASVSTATL